MPDTPRPKIVQHKSLSVQVCVPGYWTDAQIEEFANMQVPSGTRTGWHVRKAAEYDKRGYIERNSCAEFGAQGYIHVILDV